MKIKITGSMILGTAYGSFDKGQILTDDKYPKEFLRHLVYDCNAAEVLDYETKVVKAEEKKAAPRKKKAARKKPSAL